MIELLEARGIRDPVVLAAMASVPRERFVPDHEYRHAYADRALPIGSGQTISQPYIVALMIEALELQPDDHVLEIGTGSGYSAAVMSQLCSRVYTIERVPELAVAARQRLALLDYDYIDVRCGDVSLGWPEHAPYEAIAVTAAAPELPHALIDQLANGGRLVAPVGRGSVQRLVLLTKQDDARVSVRALAPGQFVARLGEQGWPDAAAAS